MKRFLAIVIALVFALGASDNPYEKYIKQYSSLAIKEMKRTGIPASITLAQGLLESRAGQAALATKGNNHFGIKCHNDWSGKKMRIHDDSPNECFRVYRNVEASYRDHSDFLRGRDRYKSLFELKKGDYKAWANGLSKAGYATDPKYAAKLIKLIEDYNLARFDKGVVVEVESPLRVETPVALPKETIKRNYKESISFALGREIFSQNGVPFVYAIEGESYRSIARANNLFLKELLKFNDLSKEQPLEAGSIVYLAKKKSQAAPGVDRYVVDSDGETLYSISQRFGIRYAQLQKLNILLLGTQLEEGDSVRLR